MSRLVLAALLAANALAWPPGTNNAQESFDKWRAVTKDLRTCLNRQEKTQFGKSAQVVVDWQKGCQAEARGLWFKNHAKGKHKDVSQSDLAVYRDIASWNPCGKSKKYPVESKWCSECYKEAKKQPGAVSIEESNALGQAKCCFNMKNGKMNDAGYEACKKYSGASDAEATQARNFGCINWDAEGSKAKMKSFVNFVTFNAAAKLTDSQPNCNDKQNYFISCIKDVFSYGTCDDRICDPDSTVSKMVCKNGNCDKVQSTLPCCSTGDECKAAKAVGAKMNDQGDAVRNFAASGTAFD